MDKGSGRQTAQYEEKQSMTYLAAIPARLIVCDVHDDLFSPGLSPVQLEIVLKYPFSAVFRSWA